MCGYLLCGPLDVSLSSDSGFGAPSSYSAPVRSSAGRRDYDVVESPKRKDLDGLPTFEKNFYVESRAVAAMSEREVEEYRKRREITVEGRDVPNPVKSFEDVGFPGNCCPSIYFKKITVSHVLPLEYCILFFMHEEENLMFLF